MDLGLCVWCLRRLKGVKSRGRARRYCDATCRQRAYERRRLERDYPEIMRHDEATRQHRRELKMPTPRAFRHAVDRAEHEATRQCMRWLASLKPWLLEYYLEKARNDASDGTMAEIEQLIAEAWRR